MACYATKLYEHLVYTNGAAGYIVLLIVFCNTSSVESKELPHSTMQYQSTRLHVLCNKTVRPNKPAPTDRPPVIYQCSYLYCFANQVLIRRYFS